MSALFGAKSLGFFETYGVSSGSTGEKLRQCGHFANKKEEFNFCDLVRTSFVDGPL